MKASLFTVCLVAVGLLAEAQTAKPKTTAASKPATATVQKKPVAATAQKKTTTTAKPKTTATAAKKPAPKPVVATTPAPAPTEVASTTAVAESEPVLAQQSVAETKPVAEVTEKESTKQPKKTKAEKAAKPEKVAKVKPEKPAKEKTKSSSSGSGLSVGIRGGVNALLNEFIPTEDLEGATGQSETAPGFTGGVVINYGIGNVFSIQPEILYTRRSMKFAGEEVGQKYSLQASVNTVEVPLLLKLSFGRKTRFFINAGPYAAYALDARVKFVVDGQTMVDETQKLTKDDDRLEYGVTGGLGVSIPAGPGSLLIEGRYHYSLGTDADPKPTDYVSQQVATFSVGYLFPLGRRR
ncbi:porin family protein [Larkinella bovis]|uniref:Porin family protein n=1 Tax=Larkinella bovis TaxID=683041 RepID=A0ABW0I8P1_9BACT